MRALVIVLARLVVLSCGLAASLYAQMPAPSAAPVQPIALERYRLHLQTLQAVVAACTVQKTAAACNANQVGPDDEISTPTGQRLVRYTWLRATLSATPTAKDTTQLQDASRRLDQDTITASRAPMPALQTEQVRRNLTGILARSEFQHVEDPSLLQRAGAEVWRWLFERLSSFAAYGGRNPWLSRLLETAGIVIPCTLLLWWVILQSRKRGRDIIPVQPTGPDAPSAREWQRWMQEAEAFANERHWRDAIHHIYWAAISRIEARGLWPADRARTPREYLTLLRPDHTLHPDLYHLTRTFEHIWYGHRPAGEQQYRDARALMERLLP